MNEQTKKIICDEIKTLTKKRFSSDSNLLEGILDSFALVNLLGFLERLGRKQNIDLDLDLLITGGALSVESILLHIESQKKDLNE